MRGGGGWLVGVRVGVVMVGAEAEAGELALVVEVGKIFTVLCIKYLTETMAGGYILNMVMDIFGNHLEAVTKEVDDADANCNKNDLVFGTTGIKVQVKACMV